MIMCIGVQGKMCDHMCLSVLEWLCALIFFPLIGIFWHVIDVYGLQSLVNLSWVLYENFFKSSLDLSYVICKELNYSYNCIK